MVTFQIFPILNLNMSVSVLNALKFPGSDPALFGYFKNSAHDMIFGASLIVDAFWKIKTYVSKFSFFEKDKSP